MIQFSCVCGWSVSVRPELAGQRISCPGCRQEIAVPQAVIRATPPPRTSQAAVVSSPRNWKGVALACGGLAAILAGALLFVRRAPPPEAPSPDREEEIVRLKGELDLRYRELAELRKKIESYGEAAFLTGKIEGLEAERDSLRRDLESAQSIAGDLRDRIVILLNQGEKAAPREADVPRREPPPPEAAPLSPSVADLVDRCSPAVLLVTTDQGLGAGFFVSPDGFAITNYHVIKDSRTITISFVPGGKDALARRRVSVRARAWAIDARNDLALLKADLREPAAVLEFETEALRSGDDVIAIGNPAMGNVVLNHTVTNGIISSLSREFGGTTYLQTTAAINPGNSGGPLLSRKGRIIGVVTAKAANADNIGFAIPAAAARALYEGREGPLKLTGELADWERQRVGMPRALGGSEGIAVKGTITEMILDEDNDRIVALEAQGGTVLVASISQRKVLKEITAGAGTYDLQASAANSSQVWVSNRNSMSFSKVDLSRGKVLSTIKVSFPPGDFVVVSDYLWAYGSTSTVQLVSITDEKSWDTFAPLNALAYDTRYDTVIGANLSCSLFEFDASKMISTIKELNRLKPDAAPSEVDRIVKRLKSLVKVHGVPQDALQTFTHGLSLVIEPRRNLLFFNRVVLRLDDPSRSIGILKPNPHSLSGDAQVRRFIGRYKFLDLVMTSSRNGKWVANGTHIYNVEKLSAAKELPVPTGCAAFSKDSKTLWLYDALNNAIVPFDVE